jgi:hypothetical protein
MGHDHEDEGGRTKQDQSQADGEKAENRPTQKGCSLTGS